jgi:hypothetical protein
MGDRTVQFSIENGKEGEDDVDLVGGVSLYDEARKLMEEEEDATGADATENTEQEKDTLFRMGLQRRRYYCGDMTPELTRAAALKDKDRNHRLALYQKMLTTAQYSNVTEKMKFISDFDRSEAIIPHGQVSKKQYEALLDRRPFDLYGRKLEKEHIDGDKEKNMVAIAR